MRKKEALDGGAEPKPVEEPGRPRLDVRSVVELIASHETAYLEHCRRYATA